MDPSLVLGLLAVVVAIDTVALLTLLVVTVRWQRDQTDRRNDRRSDRRTDRPLAQTGVPGGPGAEAAPPSGSDAPDPLADAISAFLGRSDGIFRAGGATAQAPVSGAPSAGLAADAPTASPVANPVAGPSVVLERAGSEVTWAPARPARYVPSGPRPGGVFERANPPRTPAPQAPAPPPPVLPRASLLVVALVGRDVAGAEVAGAVARLGPVIGGLLRERTRAGDAVSAQGPGRFVAILPDTPLAGAEALADRIAASCDAWLAAELPPLRLSLQAAVHHGIVQGPAPEGGRATGPERRRAILRDA